MKRIFDKDWYFMILNILIWISIWSGIDAYINEKGWSNKEIINYSIISTILLIIIASLTKGYTIF